MKYFGFFFLLLLFSCNSVSQNKIKPTKKANALELIVDDISKVTGTEARSNSIVWYRPKDSTELEYEEFDSIIPGLKFHFIKENEAYAVIEKHLEQVKELGSYLYLTNLDFDENFNSYYDIVIAPVTNQIDLIKFVNVEPVNYGLTNEDVVNWFRKKELEFDFDIIVADASRIEAVFKSEPQSYKKLANEIYKFCPDVIDQGHSDMDELVNYLKTQKRMWFWWD